MTSLYHIIDKVPKFEKDSMEEEYEKLAHDLVNSGLLRIDTDDKCNFIRFSYPKKSISKAFSYKELYNPELRFKLDQYFKKVFDNTQNPEVLNKLIQNEISKLKKDLSKLQQPSEEFSLKLARLFVQSAHPIVIKWLLLEEVEVFISFSNMIGDVMDVHTWQVAGQNSGMQSTNGIQASIFVSCGGDPFKETDAQHPTYGDGWPAVARLQIIAAQELGHYADIIRDSALRHVDRHSADIMGRRAKPTVISARRSDIGTSTNFLTLLKSYGIDSLIKHEETIKFFRKNKIYSLSYLYHLLKAWYYKSKIIGASNRLNLLFIHKFKSEKYFGLMLRALSADMLFNLNPQADVYKRADKDEEEAIACVEALARVPQQVIKWGYLPTKYFMEHLYYIYYGEVIPSLITQYEAITGIKYRRNYQRILVPLKQKLLKVFQIFYPNKAKQSLPSREV